MCASGAILANDTRCGSRERLEFDHIIPVSQGGRTLPQHRASQPAAGNETLFREANENIALLEDRHGTTATEPVYICECANAGCAEQLAIDPETYRRVRGGARVFFVYPGHEDPQLERVVERHKGYFIVEKTGRPARAPSRRCARGLM